MASNKKAVEAVEEAVVAAPEGKPVESVYTAAELADSHKLFGTYREIVVVALKKAGKEAATFEEAKIAIEKFRNKEVK